MATLTCMKTDFILDESTNELKLPVGKRHVCLGGPCPTDMAPNTPLYITPGYAIGLGPGHVWRAGTGETALEHHNVATGVTTRLMTCVGSACYIGDGVINRGQGLVDGVHIIGKAVTGFATGANIWVKTHETFFTSPDGSTLGLLQRVYLYGRPSITGVRFVPSGVPSFTPVVITASQGIYGNVTLDTILKNTKAAVISDQDHIVESLTVVPVTELPVFMPINGSTSMLTIEYFEVSCTHYKARERTVSGFPIVDLTACVKFSDHLHLIEALSGAGFLSAKFPSGCVGSALVPTLYVNDDCTGTAQNRTIAFGECLASLTRISCIDYT